MRYPPEFSREAQNSVEAAKILANHEFIQSRKRLLPSDYLSADPLATCIRAYVARVFLAFTKKACELGFLGTWDVPRIDHEVQVFLSQLAIEVSHEKLFTSDGEAVKGIHFAHAGSVTPTEMVRLQERPEWREYQEELLRVSQAQSTKIRHPQSPISEEDLITIFDGLSQELESRGIKAASTKKPRRSLDPNPSLLNNPELSLTRIRAAEALGITPRTVDRWIEDGKLTPIGPKGRRRFKAKDLRKILEQIYLDKRDRTET